MESLVIQFLMLNEISDLWFGYLIRKSDKEGKMNIPVVASKKSNEEDGLGLCFSLLCEKGKVYALDFEISGGRRRCESRHFCFSKESFKGGGYARLNSLKLHIKITRVALKNQWIK